MSIFSQKKFKIVAATAMSIFSLLAVAVGAFAWFAGQIYQKNEADEFDVSVHDGRFKNLYFHQHTSKVIDSETYKPVSYTFNNTPTGHISFDWETKKATYVGSTGIDMNDYTPLDFSQPILLVFELNDAYTFPYDGEICIDAITEVEGFLGSRASDNTPLYDLLTDYYKKDTSGSEDAYYYALSSVINFYCTDSPNELYNKSGGENTTLINTTYNVSNLRSKETTAAAKKLNPEAVEPDLSFTLVNNDTEEVSFNNNPSIYMSKANTTVRYVSVILDYYPDALDYIYSTYLGDRALEDVFDSHLEFLCDWGLEIN